MVVVVVVVVVVPFQSSAASVWRPRNEARAQRCIAPAIGSGAKRNAPVPCHPFPRQCLWLAGWLPVAGPLGGAVNTGRTAPTVWGRGVPRPNPVPRRNLNLVAPTCAAIVISLRLPWYYVIVRATEVPHLTFAGVWPVKGPGTSSAYALFAATKLPTSV